MPNAYIIAGPNGASKTKLHINGTGQIPRPGGAVPYDMIQPPANVLELPLHKRAEMAFKAAVEKVIEDHVRRGIPIYIWRDGQIVDILPEMQQEMGVTVR